MTCLGVEMHSLQRAARMRGLACGVWLRSSHHKRRVACPRESSPAQGLRIGQSRGSKARPGVGRGRRRIGWRRATAEKPTVVRETKGDACVRPPEMQECPRGTWRNAPARSRSIPCAKAARCARAAIAPTHVEHEERRSTRARKRARVRRTGGRSCEQGEHRNCGDHTHRGGIVEDRG